MKKLSILLALFIAVTSCRGNQDQEQGKYKRYDVKSGIVEYKTTISGKIMGSKMSGEGTSYLYFKNYGAELLNEEISTETVVMKLFLGQEKTETTKTHTMDKTVNDKIYTVDFENESIMVVNSPEVMLMDEDKTSKQIGEGLLTSMGGEKIGEEVFMGYNCEVWTAMGAKSWYYKAVLLKREMNVLGRKTKTEAVSIKFDVVVPDAKFELPNFKIENAPDMMGGSGFDFDSEEMDEGMDVMAKMSFKEWKKTVQSTDDEMKEMSDAELRQTYDMIQKMIKMKRGN